MFITISLPQYCHHSHPNDGQTLVNTNQVVEIVGFQFDHYVSPW